MNQKPAACAACGSQEYTSLCRCSFLRRDQREILLCGQCGLGQLWPMPSQNELTQYYSGGYFGFDQAKEEGKGVYIASRLKKTASTGRFLDVGCATGFVIKGIRDHSQWQVSGVEYSHQAADYARESLGLDVRTGSLEAAAWDSESFDYIHMNNVIEHETDPLALLKEGARILKPNGKLFLAMPNGRVDREPYKVYFDKKGEAAGSQDGHLYFFSPESLIRLAEKAGLKVEAVHSAGMVRGARTLGILPRNRTFYLGYAPRDRPPVVQSIQESILPGRQYPQVYHLFKHHKERLSRWAGFWNVAYDFHLLLTR